MLVFALHARFLSVLTELRGKYLKLEQPKKNYDHE